MPECCEWIDFIQPIRERWRTDEWGPLNEDHAREAWRKYSATPGEYLRAAKAGNCGTRAPATCQTCNGTRTVAHPVAIIGPQACPDCTYGAAPP